MPRTISTTRISSKQERALRHIKQGHMPYGYLVEQFMSIANDDAIASGHETLHPDWPGLFAVHRENIRERVSNRMFDELEEFFSEPKNDPGIEDLDPSEMTLVFLLGAGASAPSEIPITKDLLKHLFTHARRTNRDEVNRVARFCDINDITDIEDLLTAAHLATFCSRNPSVLRLMDYLLYQESDEDRLGRRGRRTPDVASVALLQETFQILFSSLSGIMLPAQANGCHHGVAKFAKTHRGTTIITTNYDCCMDLALGQPGTAFDYNLAFTNASDEVNQGCAKTSLVKLHGSLNWFYCETCQNVQLIDIEGAISAYTEGRNPFPVIAVCNECTGQRRGLVVPPLAMKFDLYPPLTPLLQQAEEAFLNADLIVAIGFSFAEADLYMSRMIRKSLQKKVNQKLLIVDPDTRVTQRMRQKLEHSVPHFDASRVLSARQDCAEFVPNFLSGQLLVNSEDDTPVPLNTNGSERPKSTRQRSKRLGAT